MSMVPGIIYILTWRGVCCGNLNYRSLMRQSVCLGAGVAYRATSTPGINCGWEVVFAAYPHLVYLLNSQIRTFDSYSSDF